ncbi:MAG: hypothetical protein QXD77_02475 [Candidatus Aenigmatarchaeota archaeon]
MSQAEIVREVLDGIAMPTGKETVYFPKWKGSPIKCYGDYKGRGFVANLDHRQMTLLGQEVSKKVGERYTLLPLQASYNLARKDKNFKKMNVDYWLHCREVVREAGEILPDPAVVEVGGELKYDGKIIKAVINESDVFDTLMKAGLFKEPKKRAYRGSICFENGEASVWSYWYSDEGCFFAAAGIPSVRNDYAVVALLKTDEKAEFSEKPKMRKIAESEYRALLADSKKLKEMRRILKMFKPYLD